MSPLRAALITAVVSVSVIGLVLGLYLWLDIAVAQTLGAVGVVGALINIYLKLVERKS